VERFTIKQNNYTKPKIDIDNSKTVCYYIYTVKHTTGSEIGIGDHGNQNINTLRHPYSNVPDMPQIFQPVREGQRNSIMLRKQMENFPGRKNYSGTR
jgi:hypothetical protein